MKIASPFSSLSAALLPAPADPARQGEVQALFDEYERAVFARINHFFVWLFWLQWLFAVVLAVVWSPRTWEGAASSVHPHLLAAVFLGGLLALGPVALIGLRPYDLLTRHVVAIAQVGFSALLIDLTGGRIETHFHIFGSLAFLALYRDWRVLPTATLVVVLDHLLRGLWYPLTVYGVAYATTWRTAEHAAWVLFEDAILLWACLISRREMWEICLRHEEHVRLLNEMERRVAERTHDLETANRRLVEASREAGRAEVATGVLHNVGNVLTSVNLIVDDVRDRLRSSRVRHIRQVTATLQLQGARLPEFFQGEVGRALPGFMAKLGTNLETENEYLLKSAETLTAHCGHLREIIVAQQSAARRVGMTEAVVADVLVEEALLLNSDSFSRHGIELVKTFERTPAVRVDRHKVMQILVNLLKNAKDSILSSEGGGRKIIVRVGAQPGRRVAIAVQDSGAGIAPDNMLKIFQHGFTTKKDGHGFGLHSCALAAREMAGDLLASSEGPGRGATFTLLLPAVP
ncbi:MAG TPA: ATP-binding protein [Opitutaceae bacterium]|nr:ATP-binding protein [Opitutaceae bacterium]